MSRACRSRDQAPEQASSGPATASADRPSDCTRRQNGVNTRKPRPSLLRIESGAASRSPGKPWPATPIACRLAATCSATARCGACAISFQNTAAAPVSRASAGNHLWRGSPPQHQRSSRARSGLPARPAATAPATSAPRRPAGAVARCSLRRARRGRSPARRCLTAACRAGWSERRRSSRNQTMRGEADLAGHHDGQLGRRRLGPRVLRRPQNQKGTRNASPSCSTKVRRRAISAAARSGYRASAISSPADRSSWPRRR